MPLREWSFTSYVNGEEMYQRYKSFESPDELRQHLVKLCPAKIDIGAICNHKPKDHRKVVARRKMGDFGPGSLAAPTSLSASCVAASLLVHRERHFLRLQGAASAGRA